MVRRRLRPLESCQNCSSPGSYPGSCFLLADSLQSVGTRTFADPTPPESFEGGGANTGRNFTLAFDRLDSVPLRSLGTKRRGGHSSGPSGTKHYRVGEANSTSRSRCLFLGLEDSQDSLGLEGWGCSGFLALDLSAQEQYVRGGLWGPSGRCQTGPSEREGTPPRSVCHIVPTSLREFTPPNSNPERLPN